MRGFPNPGGHGLAEESPPLPVPRPVGADAQAQKEAPPKVPEANLDQALNPKNIDASAREIYRALIKREAEKNGLPPDIADAVAAIESGYDPGAVGGVGEIGLMQVRPETAAMLGFKGDARRTREAGRQYSLRRDLSWPGLASRQWRSLPRPDEIPGGSRRGDDVGPFCELLRPGARASCGRRLALRGGDIPCHLFSSQRFLPLKR